MANPTSTGSSTPAVATGAAGVAASSSSAVPPTMPVLAADPLYSFSFNPQRNQANVDGHGGSSSLPSGALNGQFDIFEWHPAYQSCQKYFIDHAQHESGVQAVAALINITLPFQRLPNPVANFMNNLSQPASPSAHFNAYSRQTLSPASRRPITANWVSLIPFIRRLVVTGFDREPVLHGFFGDEWRKGVGPLHECERRNYLFAAKSGGWANVKNQYDMGPQETVPFLQPPQNVQLGEIEGAEKSWSQWLALEDWMVGPRAPDQMDDYSRTEQR